MIQEERYLLEVYRYIERNPVRAEMVTDPGEYPWSSYQINGLGKISDLCTPHHEYLCLSKDASSRQHTYRLLLSAHVDGELLKEIRDNTHRGIAVGCNRFKEEIEFHSDPFTFLLLSGYPQKATSYHLTSPPFLKHGN